MQRPQPTRYAIFTLLACGIGLSLSTCQHLHATEDKTMDLTTAPFGSTSDGTPVELYTLTNRQGLVAKITNYGGILTSMRVPDQKGQMGEITLGFDSLEAYLAGHPFFGATCGRVANRIAAGKFTLQGKSYSLAVNNGKNHLHGGTKGFDKVVWNAKTFSDAGVRGVRLTYRSPDGEEGYPGNLDVSVTYTLTDENELVIEYEAQTDKATITNLTNHSYWNLADAGAHDVGAHRLTLNADRYLPVDEGSIPTGELRPVKGTPMDFLTEKPLGRDIEMVGGDPGGYDHCYVINRKAAAHELTLAAKVVEPVSGRVMEVFTTEPGVQLYTGNYLDGKLESRGATFRKRHGFCLETQHFPDSIHQPSFPTTVLEPGQVLHSKTVHKFSTLPARP